MYLQSSGLIRNTDHNKCVEAGEDKRFHLVSCQRDKVSQVFEINPIQTWKRS